MSESRFNMFARMDPSIFRFGIVKLREIPAFSRQNQSALERRINNLETAMKR